MTDTLVLSESPNSDKIAADMSEHHDAIVEELCAQVDKTVQRHKDVRTVIGFKKKPIPTETLISETAANGAA